MLNGAQEVEKSEKKRVRMWEDCRAKHIFQERISQWSEVIEVPKTSRQENVEVVKNILQDRISERSQVIEVPEIPCQVSIEAVKCIPQERNPERRCEQSEVIQATETSSQDQIWVRTLE